MAQSAGPWLAYDHDSRREVYNAAGTNGLVPTNNTVAFHSQYSSIPVGFDRPRSQGYEGLSNGPNFQPRPAYSPIAMNMSHMANALPAPQVYSAPYYGIGVVQPLQPQLQAHPTTPSPGLVPYQAMPSTQSMRMDTFGVPNQIFQGDMQAMSMASRMTSPPGFSPWSQQQALPTNMPYMTPVIAPHMAQSALQASYMPMQQQLNNKFVSVKPNHRQHAPRHVSMSNFNSPPLGNGPVRSRGFNRRIINHHELSHGFVPADGTITSTSSISSMHPRGPPKKPMQTGFALWVGNLPYNTTIVDLKDHFSRGATNDIASVKFIAKSSCAFVNYKSQASCQAAQTRFHESRFHKVNLVCRLRKHASDFENGQQTYDESADTNGSQLDQSESSLSSSMGESVNLTDAYFILKSLTVDDLIMSTQSGLWVTQRHNEEALNQAFAKHQNVYLIFSVNKSGEYFGLGRMASRIAVAPSNASCTTAKTPATTITETAQTDKAAHPTDSRQSKVTPATTTLLNGNIAAPRILFTPATEFAPPGRVVDDRARGTIFWESEPYEDGDTQVTTTIPRRDAKAKNSSTSTQSAKEAQTSEASTADTTPNPERSASIVSTSTATPGNAFQVEWLSTRKVQFYKVRGMRNPLNENKEVKVARDGTAVAAEVGAKMIVLFRVEAERKESNVQSEAEGFNGQSEEAELAGETEVAG